MPGISSRFSIVWVYRFLGIAGYNRTLVRNYQSHLLALQEVSVVRVGAKQKQSFQSLKDLLINQRIVTHTGPDQPYLLRPDTLE